MIASRIYLPEPAAASFRLGQLARALAERGAEVLVLTTTPPRQIREAVASQPGVRVKRFPVLRDRAGYVRGYLQYLSFDLPLALRLIGSRRPSLVLSEPPPTTGLVVRAVCAARRVPYVYYAADLWSDASAGAGVPAGVVSLVRWAERAVVRHAAGVISVSPGVTERLAEWRTRGIATVGHGVDTEVFRPAEQQRGSGNPYFFYAGTASEVHGAMVFVEAFRAVLDQRPDAQLIFAGQGTDFAAIRAAAQQFPEGALTVLPRMASQEVAVRMQGAAATLASVAPGLGYDYAVPTKALASLACGTRVILAGPSPLGATIAEHRLGWSVPHEPAAVASCMLQALASPAAPAEARRIATWAQANVSATRVAADSAEFVLQQIGVPAGSG